ncbi:MAG UNVERIFIED_CONTAM: hypothetical protein LVR18_15835 [Planctomycetaceae bacterium]
MIDGHTANTLGRHQLLDPQIFALEINTDRTCGGDGRSKRGDAGADFLLQTGSLDVLQ